MKAVILAGGLGTRISEETSSKPKPLIDIGGMPILWHIMKTYSAFSINDFIICCGYKGYMIKEYFANYSLHNSDITLDLKKNEIVGNLDCRDTFEFFVAGSEVTCDIQPAIKNYTVLINFSLENGSTKSIVNQNEISFIAPQDVKRISFTIYGYENPENILNLGTGRYFKFLTSEEETQRKDKIIAYWLGLLALILFSIPSMMINLRSLFANKNE